MLDIAEKLRKAAGLFVELPHGDHKEFSAEPDSGTESGTRTVDQMVRASDGPNLDEITVAPIAAPAFVTSGGKADFAAIYRSAGLPTAPFSAEQMLDMLDSLPAELPLAMRRQTVKVTLGALGKTTGTTSDSIVADASRKLAALAAYAGNLGQQTKTQTAAAETEIAALEAQIADKRRAVAEAQATLTDAVQRCTTESDHLDDVLEFFSLDIPPSRHAAGDFTQRT